jgi:2-hydroxy-3-keto-5-methylthiopentenyl-1-phosphate phosphatase
MTRSGWSILCDFDGTIAVDDVVDSLLERYGLPGWTQLEQRWRQGGIGSRECMQGQVALLEVSRQALDAYLDTLKIDPAFPEFVGRAQALGISILVVSDGLDYAIRRMLGGVGLRDLPVAANRLLPASQPGRWNLTSPFEAQDCGSGTCKCGLAAAQAEDGTRTLLIGDGASDFCAARNVDLVFAKHRLLEHCRAKAIPHRPINGFADALALLPRLRDFETARAPADICTITSSRSAIAL